MIDQILGYLAMGVLGTWITWALACWLCSYLFLLNRVEMPDSLLPKLPYQVDLVAQRLGIQFIYVKELHAPRNAYGYAVSSWLGFRRVVFVNATFAQFGSKESVQFILCHEVGHHVMGHVTERLIFFALLMHWLRDVRRHLDLHEHAANRYAEAMTGNPSTVVWGPLVAKDIDESRVRAATGVTSIHRGSPTEEEK